MAQSNPFGPMAVAVGGSPLPSEITRTRIASQPIRTDDVPNDESDPLDDLDMSLPAWPGLACALASEEALGRIWNRPAEDEAWADL